MKYRKGSFKAKMNELLTSTYRVKGSDPAKDGSDFKVVFHGLIREAEGGWSVNDSWVAQKSGDREDTIELLFVRWEIFKLNYISKARVSDIEDASYEEGEHFLEVQSTAFATVTTNAAE